MNNHRPALWRTSLAALLVLLIPGTLHSQMKREGVEALARSADVIAVGKVKSLKSEWAENKTRIVTYVTLAVGEYLKGGQAGGDVVTIATPGGEIDGVGELYTHMPTFRQNEDVVVFLEKSQEGQYRVSGGSQGKYHIEVEPVSGQAVVAGKHTVNEFTRAVKMAVVE